jgi:endonuclease IV
VLLYPGEKKNQQQQQQLQQQQQQYQQQYNKDERASQLMNTTAGQTCKPNATSNHT